VVENGTIEFLGYGFLLEFGSNYWAMTQRLRQFTNVTNNERRYDMVYDSMRLSVTVTESMRLICEAVYTQSYAAGV